MRSSVQCGSSTCDHQGPCAQSRGSPSAGGEILSIGVQVQEDSNTKFTRPLYKICNASHVPVK